MDFSWLSEIFNAILSIFPRRVIVRHTHRGVKWSLWRQPRALEPGVRWYWPLISDVEVIPSARQTLGLTHQTLTTSDQKTLAVAGVIVYNIKDIVLAIGEKNYDVDDTVAEVSRAAIIDVVSSWKFEDLCNDIPGTQKDLTRECRKQLRPFGVYVHRAALTDFTICEAHSLLGKPDTLNISFT